MNFSITNTSLYAIELLWLQKRGVVHSVYRKTINLSFGNRLLALQACGSPLSPLSLITNLYEAQMDALPIQPGQQVTLHPQMLCIHISSSQTVPFDYSSCTAEDLTLSPALSCEEQETLTASIKYVLSKTDTKGFDSILHSGSPNADTLIHIAAKNSMEQALSLYRQKAWADTADTLSRLIGLGIGLTPSGDDFLCGVLAGLELFSRIETPFCQILRQRIRFHIDRTNDISGAFLSCACDGLFSRAVCGLQTLPSPDAIFDAFSAIGHSSGIDTLCGIYFSHLLEFPSSELAITNI
ncbi:MAG: DUF2877 domain-containing protein [Eubacteriales bacterium]|nr:DUF2877 domain-containing protein [Eubacteriales bacterium]